MTRESRIYFAQPIGGGPIKIGVSVQVDGRIAALSPWSPTGVEIIATIPGDERRERALHVILRRYCHHGEWYKSCPAIWRLILEAIEVGDLTWLPSPPDGPVNQRMVLSIVEDLGGMESAAEALGYSVSTMRCAVYDASGGAVSRYLAEVARRSGALPSYLASEAA